MKDFFSWIQEKCATHEALGTALFHERDIWWCKLGVNVGYEIDGRGAAFERPVVVIKKFNLDTCLVIPLTTKLKTGKYYFPVGDASGSEAVANLSQIRLVDRKRFTEKTGVLPKKMFMDLLATIRKVDFTYDERG